MFFSRPYDRFGRRRGEYRSAQLLTALTAVLALGATATPATAAPRSDPAPGGSHWRDHGRAKMPPVRDGVTRPPRTVRSHAPSEAQQAYAQRESKRLRQGRRAAAPSAARAAAYVPRGQGQVPWHRIADFRITDALVGRVDYSTGNLMLAATDFDIAGVGQPLRLTRTYNSFDAPTGQTSRPWWLGYERNLDVSGADSVLAYDETGAPVEFGRGDDGSLSTPSGYSKDLRKNADGTYTLTDRSSGAADTYDTAGRLTKVTERNGGVLSVTAHRAGGADAGFKLTETRSGRWIDLTHPSATRWEAKDNTGRTVGLELSAEHGNVLRTTDTAGRTTSYGYDGDGRIVKVTTPEGRSTAFTYDAADRVTSVRRYAESGGGSGPTYTYSYDKATPAEQGTSKVTDPLGDTTAYEHNADGEILKVTDALGHVRSSTYLNHLLQTATDAMGTGSGGTGGNVTTYGWDARNNPSSAKMPTGATSTGSWQTVAGAERLTSSTSADGEKTDFSYDAAGNTASVATSGAGGTRTFTYNEANPTCGGFQGQRCSATDADGKRTDFHYDAAGNLDSATPPAPLGRTTYTYDALGRTATVTDGRGVKLTYTYDRRDRVVAVESSGSTTVRYDYDGDGNLSTRTDSTGSQHYQFDALSRETVRTLQNGSQTVLAYTADGNVDTYTDPGGTTDYTWDAADRLTELTGPQGKKTTYGYDNNDRRTRTTYPGGTVQAQTLDDSGRPQNLKVSAPSGIILNNLSYEYGYVSGDKSLDGMKIRARTDHLAKTRTTYDYNSAGRLSLAAETDASGRQVSWQYCFDPAGNLTSQGTSPGCPGKADAFTYNDVSQLVARNGVRTGWSYDKAGNETSAAPAPATARTDEQYTDHSQLKSLATDGTTYTAQYASTDSSERTRLGGTTFHNGPLGLSGQTTAGKDTEFIREPNGTLNSLSTGGRSHFYLTDALGSVIALVDDSGKRENTYAYTPTGLPRTGTTESVPQPFRFAGGYQDPTGLYHFGARYYDPYIGRFTQPDPSGKETNPYLYADGDPLNRIDPDGHSFIDKFLLIKDLTELGTDALNGDGKALEGDLVGALAGLATETACMFVAGAAGAATAGLGGAVVAGGCALLGSAVGDEAKDLYVG
ncbi:RHS repeat-associated core domain-containing protein [Streptomyces sp. NPDC005496]|uniref:RHS repeat-associated core domain-containing protein n=1 Tax=Streptomyces sp. NPDC005496 TaxID=3364716 RepID=UPI0036BCC4D3